MPILIAEVPRMGDIVKILTIVTVVVLLVSVSTVYYIQTQHGDEQTIGIQNTNTVTENKSSQMANSTITITATATATPLKRTYTASIQTQTRTGTTTHNNTFFTDCHPTGGARLLLRIITDTTETPVQVEKIESVFNSGCNEELEVVYIDNFEQGTGGWFYPGQIDVNVAGIYNFYVQYAGKAYTFPTYSEPASLTCVTLRVPTGIVTSATYGFSSGDCTSP